MRFAIHGTALYNQAVMKIIFITAFHFSTFIMVSNSKDGS